MDLPELPCAKNPDSHYVLRDGASGLFLAAHDFPKVRETRPVLVSELKRFRNRISPKFYYLADGPQTDPEGNPAEVRFSRKTKTQYLASTTPEGKATNWSAFYDPNTQQWMQGERPKSTTGRGRTSTRAKKE